MGLPPPPPLGTGRMGEGPDPEAVPEGDPAPPAPAGVMGLGRGPCPGPPGGRSKPFELMTNLLVG